MSSEQRLDELEERLRRVEDELAITRLVLAYGPCVDSGSAAAAAELWTEDGSYEFQAGTPALRGAAGIAAMVDGAGHHRHLDRGCAHVLTAPHVRVDGDRAVAICYSLMHHHVGAPGAAGAAADAAAVGGSAAFQVSRVSANRWDLVRTPAGWRVQARTNRLLDGDPAARELFAAALGEPV